MRTKIQPVSILLHDIVGKKDVRDGQLEEALGGIDLHITSEVLANLASGYRQRAEFALRDRQSRVSGFDDGSPSGKKVGIFAMYANTEGVIDQAVDVTGRDWGYSYADIDSELHLRALESMGRSSEHFAGHCHMIPASHPVVKGTYRVDVTGPIDEVHQLPSPHFLTAALAQPGGYSHPLVFTTSESYEVITTRAFVPAFSRMGGLIHPNSRADILFHNGISRDDDIEQLEKVLAGRMTIISAVDYPVFRGGCFSVGYKID